MNISRIGRGFQDPVKAFRILWMAARGNYYRVKYRVLGRNVHIGRHFKVVGKFSIVGPGQVVIGDHVLADGTGQAVTPWTYNKEATITIGNNVFLNGTRFGCAARIDVGDRCILADCRILDTDFHSIIPDKRNDPAYIKSLPIRIGNDVWVALGSIILKGVTVGDRATISAMSVVYKDEPSHSVYGGNPAMLIQTVPQASHDEDV